MSSAPTHSTPLTDRDRVALLACLRWCIAAVNPSPKDGPAKPLYAPLSSDLACFVMDTLRPALNLAWDEEQRSLTAARALLLQLHETSNDRADLLTGLSLTYHNELGGAVHYDLTPRVGPINLLLHFAANALTEEQLRDLKPCTLHLNAAVDAAVIKVRKRVRYLEATLKLARVDAISTGVIAWIDGDCDVEPIVAATAAVALRDPDFAPLMDALAKRAPKEPKGVA